MKKRKTIKRKTRKKVVRRSNPRAVKGSKGGSVPYRRGYAAKGTEGLMYALMNHAGTKDKDSAQEIKFTGAEPMSRAQLEQISQTLAPLLDAHAAEIVTAMKSGNKAVLNIFPYPDEGESMYKYGQAVVTETGKDEKAYAIPDTAPKFREFAKQVRSFRIGATRYVFSRIFDALGTPPEYSKGGQKKSTLDFTAFFGGSASAPKSEPKKAEPKKQEEKKVAKTSPLASLFAPQPEKKKAQPKKSAPKKEEVVATIDEKVLENIQSDVSALRTQLDQFAESFVQLEEQVAKLSPKKLKNPRKVSIGGSYRFFPGQYSPRLLTGRSAGAKRRKNPSVASKIKEFKTKRGLETWRWRAADDFESMARGASLSGLREEYYPNWTNADFKKVIKAMNAIKPSPSVSSTIKKFTTKAGLQRWRKEGIGNDFENMAAGRSSYGTREHYTNWTNADFQKVVDAVNAVRRKNPRGVVKKLPVKGFKRTPRSAAQGLYPSVSYARQDRYPIGDPFHARLALIRVLSSSNARARKSVIKAVAKNYPQYAWAQWWADQRKGKAGVKAWTNYL